MTKSRTLRKAGAVVLSLAMAFSVASINVTPASAASLSKKTVSVKVKKSTKVKVKGITAKTKVTVKAVKKAKTYAKVTYSKKTQKLTITGKKKGTAKFKIKVGKKTFTLTVKVKKVATTTDDDGKTVIQSLKLIDIDGLQSDGTAVATDRIQVAIGSQVGTIARINWYVDDKLVATSSTATGDDSTFTPSSKGVASGKLVARVVTTKDTTYESDALTISKDSLRATLSDFTLEDNYEDNNVALVKADNKLIATVKVSKAYKGKIKLVKAGADGKISKTVVAERTVNPAWGYINAVKAGRTEAQAKDANTNYTTTLLSDHELFADTHVGYVYADDKSAAKDGYNTAAATAASAKQAAAVLNDDGSVTFKFVVNAAIDRGTDLFAVYDEDDVRDDDETAATPNATATATKVPYVKAPAKLVVGPVAKSDKVKFTFADESGAAAKYINNTDVNANAKTTATTNISDIKLFNDKDKTVSEKSTEISPLAVTSFEKGVAKTDHVPGVANTGKSWYLGTAKLNKDVYGAADVPLKSEAVNTNADIVEEATVAEASANPKDATVTFKNMNDAATVFFVRGKATEDKTKPAGSQWSFTTALEEAEKLDPATATGGVDVEKGAKEVTIPDALKDGVYDYTAAGKDASFYAADPDPVRAAAGHVKAEWANQYAVVIVPKDGDKFGKVISKVSTLSQRVSKFELASNVTYNGLVPAANGGTAQGFVFAGTTAQSAYVLAATGTASDGAFNALYAKDQFGNDIFEAALLGAAGSKTVSRTLTFKQVGTKDVGVSTEGISMTITAYAKKGTDADNGCALTFIFKHAGDALSAQTNGIKWEAKDDDTKQVFTLEGYAVTADKDASTKNAEEKAATANYLKLTLA